MCCVYFGFVGSVEDLRLGVSVLRNFHHARRPMMTGERLAELRECHLTNDVYVAVAIDECVAEIDRLRTSLEKVTSELVEAKLRCSLMTEKSVDLAEKAIKLDRSLEAATKELEVFTKDIPSNNQLKWVASLTLVIPVSKWMNRIAARGDG